MDDVKCAIRVFSVFYRLICSFSLSEAWSRIRMGEGILSPQHIVNLPFVYRQYIFVLGVDAGDTIIFSNKIHGFKKCSVVDLGIFRNGNA